MKIIIEPAPWVTENPDENINIAAKLLSDRIWEEAAIDFHAKMTASKITKGAKPKGMQPYINAQINKVFPEFGWIGESGRYVNGHVWIRVTFRHQMSLGSDVLTAWKVYAKNPDIQQLIIFAGDNDFLKIISPRDCNAMCSYEKFKLLLIDCKQILKIPLFIGRMQMSANLSLDVLDSLREER